MWVHSATLVSIAGSSDQPEGTTDDSVGSRHRVAAGEQGHVVAPRHEALGEQGGELLPRPVVDAAAPATRSAPAPRCAASGVKRRCAEGSTGPGYPGRLAARLPVPSRVPLGDSPGLGRTACQMPVAPCRLDVSTEPALEETRAPGPRRPHCSPGAPSPGPAPLVHRGLDLPTDAVRGGHLLRGARRRAAGGGLRGRGPAHRRRAAWARHRTSSPTSTRPAGRARWPPSRSLRDADVVILQHEYGLYDGPDGDTVIELLEDLDRPCIVVAHTVLREPTAHQRSVLERVATAADAVVVMTDGRSHPALLGLRRRSAQGRRDPPRRRGRSRRRPPTRGRAAPGRCSRGVSSGLGRASSGPSTRLPSSATCGPGPAT